jgi:hypothetical protein
MKPIETFSIMAGTNQLQMLTTIKPVLINITNHGTMYWPKKEIKILLVKVNNK